MPRIFSDDDRQAIRQSLLEAGKKQFLRFGIRKTNVDELASAAGIGKGTFYNFFDSKEDLCLAIFDEEEEAMRKDVAGILSRYSEPSEAFRAVIDYAMEFVRTNSLLAVLRTSGEYSVLARGVGKEKLAAHLSNDLTFVDGLLKALHEKGGACSLEPEVVAGVLRAIVTLSFHEDEIGTEVFPEVMELLVGWVSRSVIGGT